MEGKGRATTAFMRQLTRMFEERSEDIMWDAGTIIIPDPARLEKVLPRYYKTSKFSSFQRQLNNFGYHRSYTANERVGSGGDRSKARGVCYHKVAGAPASVDVTGLLSLRPLVRRKKREAPPGGEEPPRRRPAPASDQGTADASEPPPTPPPAVSRAESAEDDRDAPPAKGDEISLTDAAKTLLMMTTCPKPNLAAALRTVASSAKRQWI